MMDYRVLPETILIPDDSQESREKYAVECQ